MRGTPIDIRPPFKGLIANVPPHLVPNDGLIDGSNVMMDITGQMVVRPGYSPFLPQGPGFTVNGVWFWVDVNGQYNYMAAGQNRVAATINGVWTTIATGLSGTLNDPPMFINYLQNNAINVLFFNNHDVAQVYYNGAPSMLPLTPTYTLSGVGTAYTGNTVPTFATYPSNTQFFFTFQVSNTGSVTIALNGLGAITAQQYVNGALTNFTAGQIQQGVTYNFSYNGSVFVLGTNLPAPVARDAAVIAGRVLAINCSSNGGFKNIVQCAWTAAFDCTVWPALAYQNLVDTDDPLVGIYPLGSGAGVIWGQTSGWLVQAVSGAQDPGAFIFTPIQGMTIGAVSPASIIPAEGLLYWLGTDLRVWATNGTSAWIVSDAIDPVIKANVNTGLSSQIHGTFNPTYRQLCWWVPSTTTGL